MGHHATLHEYEKLNTYHGEYMVDGSLPRSQVQDAYDEVLMMQKEFASEIYITRDREKYL